MLRIIRSRVASGVFMSSVSMVRPSRMMVVRSAIDASSLSLWEIMMQVMPWALSWRSRPSRCSESWSFRAAVGSSRISSLTSLESALAISMSCCLRTPSRPTGVTGLSFRPTRSISAAASALDLFQPISPAVTRRSLSSETSCSACTPGNVLVRERISRMLSVIRPVLAVLWQRMGWGPLGLPGGGTPLDRASGPQPIRCQRTARTGRMTDNILEMRSITKTFPGVKALQDVSLDVRRGEIHAICGENGAGKSTLMKVLSGVYHYGSYEGDIVYEGDVVRFHSINDSEHRGIVIIHQEHALVPYLSVAENIFLGNERRGRGGLIDWNQTNAEAAALMERVGLKENPVTPVGQLS